MILQLSAEEARALIEALDQYVQNGVNREGVECPYEADPHLTYNECTLDRLNMLRATGDLR